MVVYLIAIIVDIQNPDVAGPVLLVPSRQTTHDCFVEVIVWENRSYEDRHQIYHHHDLLIACRHCRMHCFEILTVVMRNHKLYLDDMFGRKEK